MRARTGGLMLNFIALLFLVSGMADVAGTFFFRTSGQPIRIELSLLIDLLWICIAVGLWRRKEAARILALAQFLVGCFSVLIVLAVLVVHWRQTGSVLGGALGG